MHPGTATLAAAFRIPLHGGGFRAQIQDDALQLLLVCTAATAHTGAHDRTSCRHAAPFVVGHCLRGRANAISSAVDRIKSSAFTADSPAAARAELSGRGLGW